MYTCVYVYLYAYIYTFIRTHSQIRWGILWSKVASGGETTRLAARGVSTQYSQLDKQEGPMFCMCVCVYLQLDQQGADSAPSACDCCFPYRSALIYYRNPTLKLPPSVASAALSIRLTLKMKRYWSSSGRWFRRGVSVIDERRLAQETTDSCSRCRLDCSLGDQLCARSSIVYSQCFQKNAPKETPP